MQAHFSCSSLEASNMVIDQALNKGCEIFERKFQSVLKNAQAQGSSALDSIVRSAIARFDRETGLSTELEPAHIRKDNMVARSASVDKRTRQAFSKSVGRSRASQREYQSSADSQLKSRSRSRANSRVVNRRECLRLNPEYRPSDEEQERAQMEDKYRRWRAALANSEREQQLAEEMKKRYEKDMESNTLKERADLEGRKLLYTFDYQGKVMLCSALNRKRQLHVDSLHTHLNAKTPLELRKAEEEDAQSLEKLKKEALRGEIFKSMIDMGRHKVNPERPGCDYQKNEQYNNSNSRQVSSIPFMQATPGVRVSQAQNAVYIQKTPQSQKLSKDQFLQIIKNRRFVSYRIQDLKIDEQKQNWSAMTGELTKKTRQTESDQEKSKLTSSTMLRRTGDVRRKAAYKVAPFNLFNTTQDFFKAKKAPVQRGDESRIRVEDRMANVLLQ